MDPLDGLADSGIPFPVHIEHLDLEGLTLLLGEGPHPGDLGGRALDQLVPKRCVEEEFNGAALH